VIRDKLRAALLELPTDPRFQLLGDWELRPSGEWYVQLRTCLGAGGVYLPKMADWYLVANSNGSVIDLKVFPAKLNGVTATFPHQDFNGPIKGNDLWLSGKPCLERPTWVFGRNEWRQEPRNLAARISWRISRLLGWIDAASNDQLMRSGDPLELPTCGLIDLWAVLGFNETYRDLLSWESGEAVWGFARIAAIDGSQRVGVITEFLESSLRSVKDNTWSRAIDAKSNLLEAVWIKLPRRPVIEP
jgi:hypothetical protein